MKRSTQHLHEGHSIIYTNETYILTSHIVPNFGSATQFLNVKADIQKQHFFNVNDSNEEIYMKCCVNV